MKLVVRASYGLVVRRKDDVLAEGTALSLENHSLPARDVPESSVGDDHLPVVGKGQRVALRTGRNVIAKMFEELSRRDVRDSEPASARGKRLPVGGDGDRIDVAHAVLDITQCLAPRGVEQPDRALLCQSQGLPIWRQRDVIVVMGKNLQVLDLFEDLGSASDIEDTGRAPGVAYGDCLSVARDRKRSRALQPETVGADLRARCRRVEPGNRAVW